MQTTVFVHSPATLHFKWIRSPTEPSAPLGYIRWPNLDINIGALRPDLAALGKYWAFLGIEHPLTVEAQSEAKQVSLSTPFTINKAAATTPYMQSLYDGRYDLTFPDEIEIAGKRYKFKKWITT